MIAQFTQFILRRVINASLLALIFSLLPFTHWISMVIVALVTLSRKTIEGLVVLLWAILPAIAWAIAGNFISGAEYLIISSGLVWLLAWVLKYSNSWQKLLWIAVVFGMAMVLIMHMVIPHFQKWWLDQFIQALKQSQGLVASSVTIAQLQQTWQYLSPFVMGILITVILFMALIEVGIARGLQERLSQPLGNSHAGLGQKLRTIRLHYISVFLLAMLIVLAIWGPIITRNFLPVIFLPFFLAGISLVHGLIAKYHQSWLWLVGFYVALLVGSYVFPLVLLLVILLAVVDSFVNFRTINLGT